MTSLVAYPHLTSADDGSIHIGRTRYKVLHLAAEHFHYGWTAEELLRQHPDLRPEDVYSALTYFYDHHDEMVAQLSETAAAALPARDQSSLSRDELLKRLGKGKS